MDPKIERINGEVKVWCAIPETDQIKINGDMYGPINTPHPISVKEVKLMLFYGKDVKAVEPGATKEEIKAAYRRLVKIHHPDRGGIQDNFIKLNNAYEVLKEYYNI